MWGLGAHYLCHVNEIKRVYIILGILLICYMIYGIAHAVKNIYKEEMDYKLRKGSDALLDKFEQFRVSNIIDVNRVNTCVRKKFLGLF